MRIDLRYPIVVFSMFIPIIFFKLYLLMWGIGDIDLLKASFLALVIGVIFAYRIATVLFRTLGFPIYLKLWGKENDL